MGKKKSGEDKKAKRARPMVVSRHGKYRFQTGMVTATLLQRGLDMADAFAISNLLREGLAGVNQITTDELQAQMCALVKEQVGLELEKLAADDDAPVQTQTLVRSRRGLYPFSHGVMLRQLMSTGVAPDPAMALADEIGNWLSGSGHTEVPERLVHEKVIRLLRFRHGDSAARRYQFVNWIRRCDSPVIILIGGATGTGKSSLATELAAQLGIRMVTSTDMIRETMRTVLSPEVVPGLHDHSFRGMLQGGRALSNPREKVLAGFHQQASQVSVGIRAVIRRALRERSHLIIEGTHIRPPFHQYISPDADVLFAGLVLAVPEEDFHRARFPQRARRQFARDPDAYLDAFQSVRWIHDDLLHSAEEASAVVVANENLEDSLTGVIDYLSQAIPLGEHIRGSLISEPEKREVDSPPTMLLILDGLSDEPNPALDGKTPLAAAETPFFRMLAGSGGLGLIRTGHAEDHAPSTDEGLMALLGAQSQNFQAPGRGLLEAIGQGVPLVPGAVLFRGNLATVAADGTLNDRRAGRIRAGVEDLVAGLRNVPLSGGVVGHVYPGHEHRVVVMLTGPGLSDAVCDTDPGGQAAVQRVISPQPLNDSPAAARTAEALKELTARAGQHLAAHTLNLNRRARGLFEANCLIVRGAAQVTDFPVGAGNPEHRALVAACPTALGVARLLGMQTANTPTMTGNLDTDVDAKFDTVANLLMTHSFVAVHFKGTDIAAHDRRPLKKRDFISSVDRALGRFLNRYSELADGLRIIVSADHGTSSITGNHLPDPVPLLLATWSGPTEEERFDEASARQGALGLLEPGELSEMLWPEEVH